MPKPPNILFVLTDQWRADCLGFSGHPAVETPYIDTLFSEGTSFSHAYSACPTCIPARAALWTGLRPENHGRTGYRDGEPWNYPQTLPQLLADAGYHTQAVGKMHVHPPRKLLGFHNVVLHDGLIGFNRRNGKNYALADDYHLWLQERAGADACVNDTGLGVNSWVVNPWPYEERYHPTNWVASQSIDFLRRRDRDKPFFLTTSFVRPHPPFDPPAHYLQRYLDKALPQPPVGDWTDHEDAERRGLSADFVQTGRVDPVQARRAQAAYYALISHVDQQMNRIILTLQDEGILDETMIVFASDHGEMLGDHNMWNKAMGYEGSARIPLILRFPRSWEMPRQQICSSVVELRDFLPTFCDIAGVSVPQPVDGRSLLPLCRGEQVPWRDYLHGQHEFGPRSNHWVTNGSEKFLWYPQTGEEQFFDLIKDPREEHNLIATRPERAAYWRDILTNDIAQSPPK